ncbi:TonB family protein [Pseudoduganella lurida]|uniref:TonB family protein n=1 Tax=Pseudoduganella lurida TaxID=1036180 RepID=A0A562QVY7_9BURK|nr:energy transducer TonB [Pseudoduganella lurida]TWI60803.1 TonB family protein [Pseudoduganella lurida]
MASPTTLRLAAASALLAATAHCAAQDGAQVQEKQGQAKPVPGSCGKPEWPKEALRFEQEGEVTLGFLVGEQGTVRESKVVTSSGFPLLDSSARTALGNCRFTPATEGGKAVAAWTQMKFAWTLTKAAPTALERTYATGGTDIKEMVAGMADRGEAPAIVELTKAAVRGDAAAQSWMGARYAAGKDVPRDALAAATWYGRAAAGGDRRAAASLARLQEAEPSLVPATPAAAAQ